VAVEIRDARVEEARAAMIALFPGGFEEVEHHGSTELVAYTDAAGEERVWHVFGSAQSTDVEDGWEERWQRFHRPVQVGRLWVGPPWEEPREGMLAVVIDPGRAFGTGAHPTTQLCLDLLQGIEPGSLLDVGSGSGVLSVAAALLGFAPVIGVDVELAAVEATLANARKNDVRVEAQLIGADEALPSAAVAVANISLAGAASVAERVDAGVLITSGYLLSEEPALRGWSRAERRVSQGWAADVYHRV
jgi:ribosomal protein L11 methyltransferase